MVAGNDYGSTTETYLLAPFLAFWSGVWPLRILMIVLSAVAAYALYRLALPIFGRVPAAALALIGWTTSGAMALMFLRAYMGYPTGFIAQVAALALACHAMRTEQKLARTAVLAGFAAGFALWSHPVFGLVALLALIAPTLYRWRALLRWWLPARGRRRDRRQPVAGVHARTRPARVGQTHGDHHLLGAADELRHRAAAAGVRPANPRGGLGGPGLRWRSGWRRC